MPTFRFQAMSDSAHTGDLAVIDAPDRAAAVRTLRLRGITPVVVEPVEGGTALRAVSSSASSLPESPRSGLASASRAAPRAFTLSGGMSRAEMAAFVRELATAVGAGLTLVQAMKTIARQGRTVRQKEMLGFLIRELEHGRTFGDAAQSWGRPFTDLTVSLIRAGEASGKMAEVLAQAATLLDRDLKTRRTIVGATIYPAMLAVLATIAVIVVVTVIVPRVLGPLAGRIKFSDLPLPTRVVSMVAHFFGAYWWLIAGTIAAALLAWPRFYRQPGPRLSIDTGVLKVPVLGPLLRDLAVARFTRTLGTLVSAGLPALTALRTTKATLGNRAMEQVVDKVCDQVAAGRTISEPLETSGVFPPLLVQIVSVGERSGRLPQLLSQAADAMESRTEASVKVFTTVFPPLLVIVLAGVIGFVVASIILPLIQMQDYIK